MGGGLSGLLRLRPVSDRGQHPVVVVVVDLSSEMNILQKILGKICNSKFLTETNI